MAQARRLSGRWGVWGLLLLIGLLTSPVARAERATATLIPLATEGDPLDLQDLNTLLKLSIAATHTLTLRISPAPEMLDVACVRSIFCLRALGDTVDTPYLIVGLIEPVGARTKVYLILYDAAGRRTERAVEGLMAPGEVGVRIPLLARDLLRALPPLPPGALTFEAAPRAPSVAPLGASPAASQGVLEEVETLDAELLQALPTRRLRLGPELFGSAHVGGARLASYTLASTALSVELRFRDRLALTLQGGQLIGRDAELAQTFFLLTGAVSADWYWGGGLVRPLTGAEVRAHVLAPTLTAWGGSLRSGFILALGRQLDVGAVASLGITRNPYLPETVFQIGPILPVAQVELTARLRLR